MTTPWRIPNVSVPHQKLRHAESQTPGRNSEAILVCQWLGMVNALFSSLL